MSVGVAEPAAPTAGVMTVKLTVPMVAVWLPTLSFTNTVRVEVVDTEPSVKVKSSFTAFIFTKVMVRVWVAVLPKASLPTKVTVTIPLLLQRSAGFTVS